jgi:hypothetical protein
MSLKVLCAGCSKEERDWAEAAVREAVGRRAQQGAWRVSLVRMADKWSVTLDASSQGLRPLTLVAAGARLRESIVEALPATPDTPGPPPLAPPPAPPAQARAAEPPPSHLCDTCHKRFVVIYEAAPGEGEEAVAVACPHCWKVSRVMIGERAAGDRDYRAEKA